ncbi:hypothetical protein MZO42_16230 [Sphingomonas psychrotolerans]|uniref:Uncharacterized protein n=1 Tax=Sphingomonas psychrotolerans TaxID=1327635 RepID=A0ABU3N6V5_9SPHN|nr:hypothetical protein [Sphingomonas psychrotolerans]MDT8760249.1 hypothetical protein [Sphingomonas psychrotolerans]
MATFKPNVPVVQKDPVVSVDVTAANPIPVGKHTFILTVVDDSGNESDKVAIDVIVRDTDRPTAVLDLVDKSGNIITTPVVSPGASFILSAARSKDATGTIKEYRFTMDPA